MDSNDYEKLGAKLEELFGDNIADPEVFPWRFKFQMKFVKYIMSLENENASEVSTT